ncbi:MAG: nucleoside phosphorylase [Spirochaetales bacterium]|nr:nucleoside phosphorylase [Spirochaetales bacterium]
MKQPHIDCESSDIAPYVILPGDPARVDRIASFLEESREVACNREFKTVTGRYQGVPVTVTSTGIGGASMVIALEELINCGGKFFVRTGSCGACQPGIGMGELVLPTGVVREDGASKMYLPPEYPAVGDHEMMSFAVDYCKTEGFSYHLGITRSHDSFYIDNESELMALWSRRKVLASDMETATLYALASYRGVRALSILNNVVLYQGDLKEGIGDYVGMKGAAEEGEKREILTALATLKLCSETH